MAGGGQEAMSTASIPPEERRARRRRLAVIVAVGLALLAGSAYVGQRRQADVDAADQAARRVAAELAPQLDDIDLASALPLVSAARFRHELPITFPTMPRVDDAELVDASARPDRITLTYQLTSHGIDRCVTGRYSTDSGTSTQVTDCRAP